MLFMRDECIGEINFKTDMILLHHHYFILIILTTTTTTKGKWEKIILVYIFLFFVSVGFIFFHYLNITGVLF